MERYVTSKKPGPSAPEEETLLRAAIEAHHRDRSRLQEIEAMAKTIAQQLIEEGEIRGLRAATEAYHRDRSRLQEIEAMAKTITQQLIEEGEIRGKAIAQSLIEESEARGEARGEVRGEVRGEARGEARGEVRGRQLVLLNQLQAKFGELSSEVERRLRTLSMTELDHLAIQLIRAASLGELGL